MIVVQNFFWPHRITMDIRTILTLSTYMLALMYMDESVLLCRFPGKTLLLYSSVFLD